MTGVVSTRTAKLGLISLRDVLQRAERRRNGRALPADVEAALVELEAAASNDMSTSVDLPFLDRPHRTVRACEEIDVATAAVRLGITPRAVRLRLVAGSLAGHQGMGRRWVVEWTED